MTLRAAFRQVFEPLWFFPRHRKHFKPFEAVGPSMLPALQPLDVVLALPLTRMPLERGVIVTFRDGWHEEHEFSCKRVIALPGEEIEIRGHEVIVDGQVLTEPYATPPTHGLVPPRRMGPDECFVMGDNRCQSCDSRTHGPLPVEWIVGRAVYRIRPWERSGRLDPEPAQAAMVSLPGD
jgi:signal peptidase I